jgi:photosystem II stability/assembly factor-like uncharacterized protein
VGDPEVPDAPPDEPAPDEPAPDEPAPDEPAPDGDPEPVPDDPFLDDLVQIDADMDVKTDTPLDADPDPTLDAEVRLPGEAETVQAVPGPPGPRTAVRGQHNWVSIGPRNVGGRVRAVAIHPTDRRIMYAGPASGGVFKSLDGAESWFPLWHDEPSLSMASLSICDGNADVVWAATGETSQGRSGKVPLPNAGVLRSIDGGASWTQPAAGQAIRNVRLHAVAAHPQNQDVAFAVGPTGVYRTTDGGTTWTTFAARRKFSDVAFARFAGGLRLFLVASGPIPVVVGAATTRRGLVMRIDDPDNANVAAILPDAPIAPAVEATPHPLLANGSPTPAPPAGAKDPADGKLAIYEDSANAHANPVVYVAFADADDHALGVFRCRDAHQQTPDHMTFTRLPPAASFANEGQGDYNLALAVNPQNANHLAFGMQALYLNRNANGNSPAAADWLLPQAGAMFHIDPGHHADHHALVFAEVPPDPYLGPFTAGTILLWDANDGGLSASGDWATGVSYAAPPLPAKLPDVRLPLPANVITWRKRSHGIVGAQVYDLAQHPRLPTVVGCGFQDNGAWVATSGPSWQFLLSADGGFVAFDPDDPYRILATWQEGVADCRFPGVLRDSLPLLGDLVLSGSWPRELEDGFLSCDRPPFLADTAFHPSLPGRLLTVRKNRLYGTGVTTGDRWQPKPVGTGIEIVHEPTSADVASSSLEVHDTVGARALGFVAQRNTTATAEDALCVSRVRSLLAEPIAIPDGEQLRLSFSNDTATGAQRDITVPLAVGAHLPANATAAELAAYLTQQIGDLLRPGAAAGLPRVTALPLIWPATARVIVTSTDSGRAARITVGGSAAATLGVVNRVYLGADAGAGGEALPAMVELPIDSFVTGTPGRAANLTGKTLELTHGGGAMVPIDFDHDVPNAASVRAADLAAALRDKLPAADFRVLAGIAAWGIRLSATDAAPAAVTLTDDMVADLSANDGLDPGASGRSVRINRRNADSKPQTFNLSPAGNPPKPRRLRVGVGGNRTPAQDLDTAFTGLGNLTAVTPVELCHVLRRLLVAAPAVHVRCDLDIYPDHSTKKFAGSLEGRITELGFGPTGSRSVWVGDELGRLFHSTDDGETWQAVPAFPPTDRYGSVEAIAVRPDAPDTVLVGVFNGGVYFHTVPFLFRTTNGGQAWDPVGAGIEDVNGHRAGVSAIVIDPAEPENSYVATELGVFRSIDAGATYTAFNEGLPNAPVVDVTFEPTTRMLRAGLWGRGVYERHVGTRAPKDVRLYIRSTALDDGTAQPSPGTDLLAHTPAALPLDASPDIKLTRRDPRRGLLLDGVEFDDELRHEDVREGDAFACVQVHNGGAFSTSKASVAVLWAPADAGPPPIEGNLGDALAAGPIAAGTRFGSWTVMADGPLPDPQNIGHNIVAPGYPRIAIVGTTAAPFTWTHGDLDGHRRVGLLALCRADEDPLASLSTDVLDLVRGEPKAAYRECDVIPLDDDSRVLIRATGAAGFRIEAPSPASVHNLADGAAPLGLAVAPAGTLEVQLGRQEPYDLSASVGGFRLTTDHDITITFSPGQQIADGQHATAEEIAAIANAALVAARVPVRLTTGRFPAPQRRHAVFVSRLGAATFAASGTAATLLGVTAAQGTTTIHTNFPHRGPWDVTGNPELHLVVRTPVEVRLGPGIPGLPVPAAATASEVRAAINRQLDIGAAFGVRAEPRTVRMAVRRSATEAAASRVVSGSYALADLFGSPDQIASADDRAARLRALSAQDVDALTAGQRNYLYVRVANTGNVRLAPARLRLFELALAPPAPVARGNAFGTVTQALAPGDSAILEVPFDLGARDSGSRIFVLAVADLDSAPLDQPDTFPTLDGWHTFALQQPAVALRELVVA